MTSMLMKRVRGLQARYGDALLTSLTLQLLLMMFVVAPLRAAGIGGQEAVGLILIVTLMLNSLVLSGNLVTFVLMLALTLVWIVAHAVFGPGRVNYHRVIGAILLYLLIALTFAPLFALLGLIIPDAFRGLAMEDRPTLASSLVYFSFVTLTSTGYGDIVPVHPVARALCNMETIIGQLYPATLLARLVTLELAHRR